MRIALLNTKETPRARYILDCFAEGVRAHGDEAFWVENAEYYHLLDAADLGVQVCLPNRHHDGDPGDLFRLKAWERLKAQGKRVLVVDTGFVKNQYDFEIQRLAHRQNKGFDVGNPETYACADNQIHYELAFDGIKGAGDHCIPARTASDRWKLLDREIKQWRKAGRTILLMTQPLHGQSSQEVNIFDLYGDVVTKILRHTKLKIVARIHPRVDRLRTKQKHVEHYRYRLMRKVPSGTELSWSRHLRLEDDLVNVRLAVVYSSSAGVTSVLEGVPLYVGSQNCIAAPVAEHSIQQALIKPIFADRKEWAHGLAYSQWTCSEMRSGAAWAHYRQHAQKPMLKELRRGARHV